MKKNKDERVREFLFRFYRDIGKIESDYICKSFDDCYPTKWLPGDHPYLEHMQKIRSKQHDILEALDEIEPFCWKYKFKNIPHELFYQNYSTFDFSKVDPSVKELVEKAFETGRAVGKIETHNFFVWGLKKAVDIQISKNNEKIKSVFGRIVRFLLLRGITKTLRFSKKYFLMFTANFTEINNRVKELIEFANNRAQNVNSKQTENS